MIFPNSHNVVRVQIQNQLPVIYEKPLNLVRHKTRNGFGHPVTHHIV